MTILAALAVRLLSPGVQEVESSQTIPLSKHGDLYCVQLAAFGGEPGWFVLDTGGYRSYVTAKGLARLKKEGAETKHGEEFSTEATTLGGFPIPPVRFILDKREGRFSADPDSDGVIGVDVLSQFRVGLDLRSRTIRFWPAKLPIERALRDWFTPDGQESVGNQSAKVSALSLWSITNGLFGTTLTLNGEGLAATVDTGSPVTLVSSDFEGKAFQGLQKVGDYPVRFYAGKAKAERFNIEGLLDLGGITLPGKREIGRIKMPKGGGSIVGCDILADFRLLLDFPGRRMYARPYLGAVLGGERTGAKSPYQAIGPGICPRLRSNRLPDRLA